VTRKLTPLVAAVLLLGPAVAAGCGGGNDNGNRTKGTLSTTDNLKVAQDEADIQEFCNIASSPQGEIYDRALFSVIAATDDLIIIYKKHTDATYYDAVKKREIKLKQLEQDLAKKLNGCGRDGKREGAKLAQGLRSA
jgi:hypothetical protein